MTFSVLAIDGNGAVGMAVTSSTPAVAARCIHLRAGVGGASSQNITDPRLGTELMDSLQAGLSAQHAMARVVEGRELINYRQLSVLGVNGEGAAFTGTGALGVHHERVGPGVVASGNALAATHVIDALVEDFVTSTGDLEGRLLAALLAGLEAGGEAEPIRSAGLAVVRDVPWRVTDLRVDWSEKPLGELRELLELWLPQRDEYVMRALDPDRSSYGVLGDE